MRLLGQNVPSAHLSARHCITFFVWHFALGNWYVLPILLPRVCSASSDRTAFVNFIPILTVMIDLRCWAQFWIIFWIFGQCTVRITLWLMCWPRSFSPFSLSECREFVPTHTAMEYFIVIASFEDEEASDEDLPLIVSTLSNSFLNSIGLQLATKMFIIYIYLSPVRSWDHLWTQTWLFWTELIISPVRGFSKMPRRIGPNRA